MHPRIRAERRAFAQARIEAATAFIAENDPKLSAYLQRIAVKNKDPELEALFRLEAVADFLEAMFEPPTEPPPKPDVFSGADGRPDAEEFAPKDYAEEPPAELAVEPPDEAEAGADPASKPKRGKK